MIPSKTALGNFFRPGIAADCFSHVPTLKKQASPTTMTIDAHSGDNVIADINPATGVAVRSYVTPTLDGNISMTDIGASATYYYNADERQSVKNLSDSTGAVAQSYDYTAYGDKVDSLTSGSIEQRYTYTGRELNEVSGDYYFRYRMYGAGIGGFLSRDPVGYIGGGMGLYNGYFAAIMGLDPMGDTAKKKLPEDAKDAPYYFTNHISSKNPGGVTIPKWRVTFFCTKVKQNDEPCTLRFKASLKQQVKIQNGSRGTMGKLGHEQQHVINFNKAFDKYVAKNLDPHEKKYPTVKKCREVALEASKDFYKSMTGAYNYEASHKGAPFNGDKLKHIAPQKGTLVPAVGGKKPTLNGTHRFTPDKGKGGIGNNSISIWDANIDKWHKQWKFDFTVPAPKKNDKNWKYGKW